VSVVAFSALAFSHASIIFSFVADAKSRCEDSGLLTVALRLGAARSFGFHRSFNGCTGGIACTEAFQLRQGYETGPVSGTREARRSF
jgi:hypothetical protein